MHSRVLDAERRCNCRGEALTMGALEQFLYAPAEYPPLSPRLALVEPSHDPAPTTALDSVLAEAEEQFSAGCVPRALELLERARALSERPGYTDIERARVLLQIGCCRFTDGAIANAVSLLTLALDLCDHTSLPCDSLRARALVWRSRCYQRQRDWPSARLDVERALELARALSDDATTAPVLFQASIVAEWERQWLLARFYAEEAKCLFEELGDLEGVGKSLNNLGGLNFLLGDTPRAIECLEQAAGLAADRGSDLDLGYAVSSLAQVRLRSGDAAGAELSARSALELLDDRADHLNEIGGAQLVLAATLLAQEKLPEADAICRRAEETFARLGSPSHCARALLIRGDIATAAGDPARASELYKQSALSLQEVHF